MIPKYVYAQCGKQCSYLEKTHVDFFIVRVCRSRIYWINVDALNEATCIRILGFLKLCQ